MIEDSPACRAFLLELNVELLQAIVDIRDAPAQAREIVDETIEDMKPFMHFLHQELPHREDALAVIEGAARLLARFAAKCDTVVTMTQQPLYPLAMGHYITTIDVRPARETAT